MLQETQLLLTAAMQCLVGLHLTAETDVNTACARAMPTLPVAGIESTEHLSRQGNENCGEASGEDVTNGIAGMNADGAGGAGDKPGGRFHNFKRPGPPCPSSAFPTAAAHWMSLWPSVYT